jgi:hypothetical protein
VKGVLESREGWASHSFWQCDSAQAGSSFVKGPAANFCGGASGAEPRRMSLWTLQVDTRYCTVSVYPPSHAKWKGLEG